jgi:hypothetical protein
MGKEIQAGLYVVGALLLIFCTLLTVRFSGGRAGLPDWSISVSAGEDRTTQDTRESRTRTPVVRFHPTIVKSSAWDMADLPNERHVRTASVDAYLDDEPSRQERAPHRVEPTLPRPIPAEYPSEMVNPRSLPQPRPIPRHRAIERSFDP